MAQPSSPRRGLSRWLLTGLTIVVIAVLVGGGLALHHSSSTAQAAPASVLGWTPGVTRGVPLAGPLTVYFSRPMDRPSVEHAWQLSPHVVGSFAWTATSVAFRPH